MRYPLIDAMNMAKIFSEEFVPGEIVCVMAGFWFVFRVAIEGDCDFLFFKDSGYRVAARFKAGQLLSNENE